MKFCNNCDHMLYISVSEEDSNKLIYYCRNCGAKDAALTNDNICVLETHLKKGEQKFNHIINQYTKKDPTLPRISNVKCPNPQCHTNVQEGVVPEIIYMRYDDDAMKYLYICVACDTVWKTDDNK